MRVNLFSVLNSLNFQETIIFFSFGLGGVFADILGAGSWHLISKQSMSLQDQDAVKAMLLLGFENCINTLSASD